MKEIMHNVWHACVIQTEESQSADLNVEKLARLMEKNKTMRYSLMNEQEKERFETYTDCVEEYISLIAEKAFCEGAGFAAKFLAEALT